MVRSPIGAEIDGVSYWFEKTPMGDIVRIRDDSNSIRASFIYDAWGFIGRESCQNSNKVIAELIPFRYRGYVYDNETGLYYLNSRYYDPVTSRFVNADGYVSTGTGIKGYNMFSYCNNNPVSMVDPNGNCPNTIEHMKRVIMGYEDCDVYHNNLSILRLKKEMAANNYTTVTESAGAEIFVLYDNHRKYPDNIFHDQGLVITGNGPSLDLTNFTIGVGNIGIDIIAAGWEWEHVDLSLLDFFHGELALEMINGKPKINALGSIWSPSLSFDIAGVQIEIFFEIGSIGAKLDMTTGGLTAIGAYGVGGGISIKY